MNKSRVSSEVIQTLAYLNTDTHIYGQILFKNKKITRRWNLISGLKDDDTGTQLLSRIFLSHTLYLLKCSYSIFAKVFRITFVTVTLSEKYLTEQPLSFVHVGHYKMATPLIHVLITAILTFIRKLKVEKQCLTALEQSSSVISRTVLYIK